MNEWISVNDRLPENDEGVLIFNPKEGINIGHFDYQVWISGWNKGFSFAPFRSPTHWMPLPPPPEKERESF